MHQPACVRLLACRCTHSPPNLSPKPYGMAILPARFAMGGYALRGSYVTVSPAANSGGVESGPLGYAGEWEVRRDYAQIYGRGRQRAVLLVGPWRGREAGLPHPTGAHEGHGREAGGYLGIFGRSKRVESANFGLAFLVFGERLPAGQVP